MVPSTPCTGLYGCGGGAANLFNTGTLANAALLLLQFAAGAAVLFIVIAGFNMVTHLGDEGKVSQAKNGILYALGGLSVAIISQVIISSVGTENYGQGAGGNLPIMILGNIVRILRTVLNPILAVVIVLAGIYMVYAQGKPENYEKGKNILQWAILGAIIVNLANALVQAVTQGIFNV